MNKNWTGERLETGIYGQVAIEHLHRYAIAADLVHGKKVLDIACGEGYGAALMAQHATQVTGVDMEDTVIREAGEKYTSANLQFMKGTVTSIPLSDHAVDVIVSFETLEHTDQHQAMMQEFKRVLAPGGLLIISTPDKKWYSDVPGTKNPFHVKELYPQEFKDLLQQYFSRISICSQQYFSGSLVLPATGISSAVLYQGNFNKITASGELAAVYMIAVASDVELPLLPASVFPSANLLDQALATKEEEIKSTLTYKTGHLLLSPFKWIKKRFFSLW